HALSDVLLFYVSTRPPRSTLFPTRRSSDLIKVIQDGNGDWVTNRADVTFTGDNTNFGVLDRNETWTFIVNYTVTNTDISTNKGVDRKSTRLNSSHVKISYAVFCLKKKKKLI